MPIKHLGPGKNDEWRTPKYIFDALKLVFDLDPCWPLAGPCFVPTQERYTVHDNGLAQPWHGLVWVNPPFGGRRGHVPWLRKFFTHGNGIALVNALTSSDWFHAVVVPNAEMLCFVCGKTKFHRPDGSIGTQPANGIVLLGMGNVAHEALRQSGLGACYIPNRTTDKNLDDLFPRTEYYHFASR
jgi:DNA N-6-adenine-methyltransferase (Dam)